MDLAADRLFHVLLMMNQKARLGDSMPRGGRSCCGMSFGHRVQSRFCRAVSGRCGHKVRGWCIGRSTASAHWCSSYTSPATANSGRRRSPQCFGL
jgi:hypothetical protein